MQSILERQRSASHQEVLQGKPVRILYPQQMGCHSHVLTALFLTANYETVIGREISRPCPKTHAGLTNLSQSVISNPDSKELYK